MAGAAGTLVKVTDVNGCDRQCSLVQKNQQVEAFEGLFFFFFLHHCI